MGEAHLPAQQPEASQASRLSAPHVDARRPGHPGRPEEEGAPPPVRLIVPVRDRATFAALRRNGRRVRRGPITVTWLSGGCDDPVRVAYAIGRKTGGAVLRNRTRRRLRAIVREERASLRPGAYLIGAAAAATALPYGELRATVCKALNALAGPSPAETPSESR